MKRLTISLLLSILCASVQARTDYSFTTHSFSLKSTQDIHQWVQKWDDDWEDDVEDKDKDKEEKEDPMSQWAGELPAAIESAIDFIDNADLYMQAGLDKVPNILLEGPPGTGKTLLARIMAQKLEIPIFEKSSGEFHDMYIGVGPQKMKALFEDARYEAQRNIRDGKQIGALIFLDEFEGIAGDRTKLGSGGAATEEIRLLNQLLAELTRPENKHILVIAATNHKSMLDSAVIRTGRFGLHVKVDTPDAQQREALFVHYLKNFLRKGVIFRNKKKNLNINKEEREQLVENLFNFHYARFIQNLTESTDLFVSSDIKAVVEQAAQRAVFERKEIFCSYEDLMTEITIIHKNKV